MSTTVLIPGAPADASVPLTVNGVPILIPRNTPTVIPDEFLPALRDSSFPFEIVADGPAPESSAGPETAADESGGGADQGTEGDAATATQDGAPLAEEKEPNRFADADALAAFLDPSVAKIEPLLADLNRTELETVLAAEKAGKTRATLIPAIEAAIAAKSPAPAEQEN